jgi:acetolactate synthase-1/2/3 large subunit
MDSIPLVCITGQVPTHLIGNDAFQECDTVGITRPCTKHNWLVKDVNDLPTCCTRRSTSTTGRPGPVVVDIPKDVQFAPAPIIAAQVRRTSSYRRRSRAMPRRSKKAVELMARAKRPVFYTGGGVINSGPRGSKLLRELGKLTGFPITSTLMGLGAYPASDQAVARHARHARHLRSQHGDARLRRDALHRRALRRPHHRPARRVLAGLEEDPHRHRPVVDQQERQGRRADRRRLRHVLEDMLQAVQGGARRTKKALKAWWKQIDKWRARNSLAYRRTTIIKPQYAIQRLYELTGRDTYITTEVGQHQMWAAQFFKFEEPNRWMTSGGLGTMGYGLPAAIGVQLAHPDALVIDIAGEASVQMTMQEMSTAVQYRLPIKIFILNNQYMGMVRQWQQLLHGNPLSRFLLDALPDFVKLAEAYRLRRHPLRSSPAISTARSRR